jgi:hypothetical protein
VFELRPDGVGTHDVDASVRVERVGGCLLAAPDGFPPGRAIALARSLPPEPGRLAVVLAGPVALMMSQLARRLADLIPIGSHSIRLIGSRTAVADGDRSPARKLADLLDIEVVAPDGSLIVVPGGSLFVADDDVQTGDGAWWRFRPGEKPVPVGVRFPQPEWEPDLAGFNDPGVPDLVVDQLPAGLWVRRPGPVRLTDPAFAMPVDLRAMAVLVSRPGEAPLPAPDVTKVIGMLPRSVRQRLVAVPYCDQPVADARLGEVVAAAADTTVRACTGLVVWSNQGRAQVVAVDENGAPAWRPFVCELAWRPYGAAPRPLSWSGAVGGLSPIGPGLLALHDRWVVELIEAGLWIRPTGVRDGADVVAALPLKSDRCVVVVGVPDTWVEPPWRAVRRLLRQLPGDARELLRLTVPADPGDRMAMTSARACGRELAGRPLYVLESDGHLLPRFVTLPPTQWQARVGLTGPVMRIVDQPEGTFTLCGVERVEGRGSSGPVEPVSDDVERLVDFFREIRSLPAFDELPNRDPESERDDVDGEHSLGDVEVDFAKTRGRHRQESDLRDLDR